MRIFLNTVHLFALCAAAAIATEESTTPKPASWKFGTIAGEPDDYTNSTAVQVNNFKECIAKCSAIFDCIIASQKSKSEPCNLFLWNSVTKVKRAESGGEGQTAFRVFTEQPRCKLSMDELLNGKKYQIYKNDTEHYIWTINKTEDGWAMEYSKTILNNIIHCNDPDAYKYPGVRGCYKIVLPFKEDKKWESGMLSYPEAVGNCTLLGGDGLMTIPSSDFASQIKQNQNSTQSSTVYFIGLTRPDDSSNDNWVWTLPDLKIDSSPLPPWSFPPSLNVEAIWAENCALVSIEADPTKSLLHATLCQQWNRMSGYICHFAQ